MPAGPIPILLALLLAVTSAILPLAASTEGDDAGDSMRSAAPLAPGRHAGFLAADDPADWYRIETPGGLSAVVDVRADTTGWEPNRYARFTLYDATGAYLNSAYVDRFWPGGPVGGGEGDAAYLKVDFPNHYGFPPRAITYALDVAVVPLPDLAVRGMEIVPRPVETQAGPLPVDRYAEVRVKVANEGAAPARGDLYLEAYTPTDRRYSFIDDASYSLQPGEEKTFTLRWDKGRHVGDVWLSVAAYTGAMESDPHNNRADAWAWSIVGNAGFGVTSPL